MSPVRSRWFLQLVDPFSRGPPLKQGVHPKIVQERLGHATISVTFDTYNYVAPGFQEAAAAGFDKMVLLKRENEAVENHY